MSPLNQIARGVVIWNESLAIPPRRRREILIGKNERLSFINNYYAELGRQAWLTFRYFSFSRDSRARELLSLSLTFFLSRPLCLSRSLVLPVESIYVHECGFELRPLLLSRDYRRKEGWPNQYLTQTFRPRPRRCRRELLIPFEGRSESKSGGTGRISESLINLPFYRAKCAYLSRARVRARVRNMSAYGQ